jgi:hypothetical protein
VNLEGSLEVFGLRDLFLLLSTSKRSGALWLRHVTPGGAESRGVVWFRDGSVVGASADVSRMALARRLVGVGAVDDASLAAALDSLRAHGGGLVAHLLAAGSVDPELAAEAAGEQAVDAVCELMRWHEGDFAFALGVADPDDAGVAIPADETLRLADEREAGWADVATLIPSPEVVLTLPVSPATDPVLSRDEWSLVALIDGRRTLNDLVLITGAGQFRVAAVLAGLVRRGLVHVGDAHGHDHASVVERRLALVEEAEQGHALEPPRRPREPAPLSGPLTQTDVVPPAASPAAEPAHEDAAQTPLVARAATDRDEVVPPRPEPFLPQRQPEHAEPAPVGVSLHQPVSTPPARVPGVQASSAPGPSAGAPGSGGTSAGTMGAAAVAAAPDHLVERDPSINRSLLLRLIAGVRGL